jgi:hypothetical protein
MRRRPCSRSDELRQLRGGGRPSPSAVVGIIADRLDPVTQPLEARAALGGAAHAVVRDLDMEVVVAGVDRHVDRRGAGVLLGVRDSLREHVVGGRLGGLVDPPVGQPEQPDRHRRAKRGAPDGRRQPEVRQHRGVDPMCEVTELVDRELQLRLGLLEQLGRELGRPARMGRTPAQVDGEPGEALLGAVVQVALQPPALHIGRSHEAAAAGTELEREQLPLRHDCRQVERREGRDGDEELGVQHAAGDRVVGERPEVVGRVGDGDADGDRDREGGPARPEPQRRPDERREDDVDDRSVAARGDLAQHDDADECRGGLGDTRRPEAAVERAVPGQGEGNDDECADEVAQPPCPPDGRNVVHVHHSCQAQGQRADGRADRDADRQRDDQPAETADRLERRAAGDEAADQRRRDHDLEQVADGLGKPRGDGHRPVVVREQVARKRPGPQVQAAEIEEPDGDADRQPDDRRDRPCELEVVAQLRRPVVRERQGERSGQPSNAPVRHQPVHGCRPHDRGRREHEPRWYSIAAVESRAAPSRCGTSRCGRRRRWPDR